MSQTLPMLLAGLEAALPAFVITVLLIRVCRPLAGRIGLIDCPGGHRSHDACIRWWAAPACSAAFCSENRGFTSPICPG